mgnify:CR=1 FL=1
MLWDAQSGSRVRGYKGHTALVNSCCPSGNHTLASASDDCTTRLWDDRVRTCQRVIRQPYPCTAVSVSADGLGLYTGSLDGTVRVYDLRKSEGGPSMALEGHQDIVSGLSLSPDGNFLLSNAMDNVVRIVSPETPANTSIELDIAALERRVFWQLWYHVVEKKSIGNVLSREERTGSARPLRGDRALE